MALSRALAPLAALLALSLAAPDVRAADGEDNTPDVARGIIALDRPHNLVEVGVGALTLPRANLCLPTGNSCTTTDLTLLGSLRYIVRLNRRFAFGAGASLGFRPVTDDASIATPNGPIARTHSRNYFMLSGIVRYYFVARSDFDFWGGATGGAIVVSDRYAVTASGTSIIGPVATSIGTEGAMAGVGFGADWNVGRNLAIGAWTHEMLWALPHTVSCAQTNDCSTANGNLFSFEMGLSVTYRVRL